MQWAGCLKRVSMSLDFAIFVHQWVIWIIKRGLKVIIIAKPFFYCKLITFVFLVYAPSHSNAPAPTLRKQHSYVVVVIRWLLVAGKVVSCCLWKSGRKVIISLLMLLFCCFSWPCRLRIHRNRTSRQRFADRCLRHGRSLWPMLAAYLHPTWTSNMSSKKPKFDRYDAFKKWLLA